jgi:hypothetical protein
MVEETWRYDSHTVESEAFTIDAQGFLHVKTATFLTVGVNEYRNADGSTRREFTPPEVIQKALKDMNGLVVTDEHPAPRGTPVTIRNVKRLQIGSTGSGTKLEGIQANGSLVITDSAVTQRTLARRSQGLPTGLSLGYRQKSVKSPGTWQSPSGPKPYDFVRTFVKPNHLSVTIVPRAGLDKNEGTVMHLDSLGNEQLTPTKDRPTMDEKFVNVLVGGVQVSVLAAHAPLLQDKLNTLDSKITEQGEQLTTSTKQLAEKDTEITKLKADAEKLVTDSKNAPSVGELVASRIKFNDKATKLLNAEALNALDSAAEDYEAQVITAALQAHKVELPTNLTEEQLTVYAGARFDSLVATPPKGQGHAKLSVVVGAAPNVSASEFTTDSEERKSLDDRVKAANFKRDNPHHVAKS